jgi:hypothetical protein
MSSKKHRHSAITQPETESETEPTAQAAPPAYHAPEGYTRQTDEVKGFWDYALGPLHFVPVRAILTDSQIEPQKTSVLIIGNLVDRATLSVKDPDDDDSDLQVIGEPGDVVGVWAKPGMRELKELAGEKVFLYYKGEKDTGKPNPMKLFEIFAKSKGDPLPVEDKRDKSRHAKTWMLPVGSVERDVGGRHRRVTEDELF